MALVQFRGSRAIEADEPNVGMRVKKRMKIVWNRILGDVGVETA
jgi:hypothetical protein